MLLTEGKIEYLHNFSNERFFFPAVDHQVKFTLMGVQKGVNANGFWATFRFNPRVAVHPAHLAEFLRLRPRGICPHPQHLPPRLPPFPGRAGTADRCPGGL